MDPKQNPSYRLATFLGGVRRSANTGCRSSGDGDAAKSIELRFQETLDGPEHMIGLRAELRDGLPVIVLYEKPELRSDAV
jgi:hypothetical protein